MKIMKSFEIPPTAGLPLQWRDWLTCASDPLTEQVSKRFALPPLQLTCSGTAALILALTSLSKKYPAKKQVIISAYTCPLVAIAIHHCGLQIALCDLAPEGFELDTNHLTLLMNENVLAVIATHLGGQVADIVKIRSVTQSYTTFIIEDAAQALGANVGKYGDIVFFSLAVGKGLTLYEGGLLTSRHDDLRCDLATMNRQQVPHNQFWNMRRTIELLGYTSYRTR